MNNCSNCNSEIDEKRKFCNSSCSAKFNNKFRKGTKRIFSETGKQNISEANKLKAKLGIVCKINFSECLSCRKLFVKAYAKRNTEYKACSKECKQVLIFKGREKYKNGNKKLYPYLNKWFDKEVILESSWEVKVAETLDDLNIKWERPKYIKWNDGEKDRMYFPDFYLIEQKIYLDPKNPYCMKQDEFKMSKISQKVNIIYGDIEVILSKIREVG